MSPPDLPAILIVTGVSGSGKTAVATALAQRLGWPLQEGDELHPTVFAKIRSAHPLDDRDQWSWLAIVAEWVDGRRRLGKGGVIACSVLRRSLEESAHGPVFRRWRTGSPSAVEAPSRRLGDPAPPP